MDVSTLLDGSSSDTSNGEGELSPVPDSSETRRWSPGPSTRPVRCPPKGRVQPPSRALTHDRRRGSTGPSSVTESSALSLATSSVSITHLLSNHSSSAASAASTTATGSGTVSHGHGKASPATTPWRPKAPASTPYLNNAAPQPRAGSQRSSKGKDPLLLSRELSAGDLAAALEAELEEIERRYISGGGSEPPSRRSSPGGVRRFSALSSPVDSNPGGGAPEGTASPTATQSRGDHNQQQRHHDLPDTNHPAHQGSHALVPPPSVPGVSLPEGRPADSVQTPATQPARLPSPPEQLGEDSQVQFQAHVSSSYGGSSYLSSYGTSSGSSGQSDTGAQAQPPPALNLANRAVLSAASAQTEHGDGLRVAASAQPAQALAVPQLDLLSRSHITALHETAPPSSTSNLLDAAAALRVLERMQSAAPEPSSAVKAVQALLQSFEEQSPSPPSPEPSSGSPADPEKRPEAGSGSQQLESASGDDEAGMAAPAPKAPAHAGPARSLLAAFDSHAGAEAPQLAPLLVAVTQGRQALEARLSDRRGVAALRAGDAAPAAGGQPYAAQAAPTAQPSGAGAAGPGGEHSSGNARAHLLEPTTYGSVGDIRPGSSSPVPSAAPYAPGCLQPLPAWRSRDASGISVKPLAAWSSREVTGGANDSPSISAGAAAAPGASPIGSPRESNVARMEDLQSNGSRSGAETSGGTMSSSSSDLTLAALVADGDGPNSGTLPSASAAAETAEWTAWCDSAATNSSSGLAGVEYDAGAAAARAEAAALALLEGIERRVEAEAADADLGKDIFDLGLELNMRLARLDLDPGAAFAPGPTAVGAAAAAAGQQAEREEALRAARVAAFQALQARLLEVQARYEVKRRRRRRASRTASMAGGGGGGLASSRKHGAAPLPSPRRRYGPPSCASGAAPSKTLQAILAQLVKPSPTSAEKRNAGAAELDASDPPAGAGGRDGKGPRYNVDAAAARKVQESNEATPAAAQANPPPQAPPADAPAGSIRPPAHTSAGVPPAEAGAPTTADDTQGSSEGELQHRHETSDGKPVPDGSKPASAAPRPALLSPSTSTVSPGLHGRSLLLFVPSVGGTVGALGGVRDSSGKEPRYNVDLLGARKGTPGSNSVHTACQGPLQSPSTLARSLASPGRKPLGAVPAPVGAAGGTPAAAEGSGKEPRYNVDCLAGRKVMSEGASAPATRQVPLMPSPLLPSPLLSRRPASPGLLRLRVGDEAPQPALRTLHGATAGSGPRHNVDAAGVRKAAEASDVTGARQPAPQPRTGSAPLPQRSPRSPLHADASVFVASTSPTAARRAPSPPAAGTSSRRSPASPTPTDAAHNGKPALPLQHRSHQLPDGSKNIRSPQTAVLDAARAPRTATSPDPRSLPPRASARAPSPAGPAASPGALLASPDTSRFSGVPPRPETGHGSLRHPPQQQQQPRPQPLTAPLHMTYSISPQPSRRTPSGAPATPPSTAAPRNAAPAPPSPSPPSFSPARAVAATTGGPGAWAGASAPKPRPASAPRALTSDYHFSARSPTAATATTVPRPSSASSRSARSTAPGGMTMDAGLFSRLPPPASTYELDELRALCAMAKSLADVQPMQRVELWARLEKLLAYKLARSPHGAAGGEEGLEGGGGGAGRAAGLTPRSHSPLRGYAAVWERRRLGASCERQPGGTLGRSDSLDGSVRAASRARSASASASASTTPAQRALGREFDAAAAAGDGAAADRPRRPASASAVAPLRLLRSPSGAGAAPGKESSSPGKSSGPGEALLDCTLEVVRRLVAPNATLARAMSLNWQAVREQAVRQDGQLSQAGEGSQDEQVEGAGRA